VKLPTPPEKLRIGPFRQNAFHSRLHDERVASILGICLGVSFLICFVTGLLSHFIQQPGTWFYWPARPAALFRITQGLHVFTGLASIPLLFLKLWSVYPKFWTWPPVEDILHLVERISLLPLVAGSLFLVVTGVQNINYWYPWGFYFINGHFWAAWVTIGALIVHIGAKATTARRALSRTHDAQADAGGATDDGLSADEGLSRRGFIAVGAAASGLVVATMVGETLRPLRSLAILAPRRSGEGPSGFPINREAREAGVVQDAMNPGWRLSVEGAVPQPYTISLEELLAMPQRSATLPISCVEGWSAVVPWSGVSLSRLLAKAGALPNRMVRVESLERHGNYKSAVLNPGHAGHPDTMLALKAYDKPLHIQHGFPARLISPSNPGVMQTKWVARLVIL